MFCAAGNVACNSFYLFSSLSASNALDHHSNGGFLLVLSPVSSCVRLKAPSPCVSSLSRAPCSILTDVIPFFPPPFESPVCGGADVISFSPPAATGSHNIVSSVSAFHTLLHPSLSLNSLGKFCLNAGNESISWPPFLLPPQGL